MNVKYDKLTLVGIILLALSFLLFVTNPSQLTDSDSFLSTNFFLIYCISIFYMIVVWIRFRWRMFALFSHDTWKFHTLVLLLFSVSAFTLNREIVVYNESATWLSVLLTAESILLLILLFLPTHSRYVRLFILFLAPTLLLFHFHQFLLSLPMLFIGMIGTLFLGIGLLITVPMFYLIALIRLVLRLKLSQKEKLIFASSFSFPILVISIFLVSWYQIDKGIESNLQSLDAPFSSSTLPDWVLVSKHLPDNHLTEAYLKSGMIYQDYPVYDFFSGNLRSADIDEKKIHDPIITICMSAFPSNRLGKDSRIRMLNFLHNKRHQTADRFWSGSHLTTDQVVTNVQVFQKERLTFTEMILTVANNSKSRWRTEEEAIFTFQLPEGGVITSLSLWINGIEEKGILTTKSKAENAYNTIVGREVRDPSVIYWMEGNKARIRVFPCTPKEKRKFKVGITAPMIISDNKLEYQPISFQGPEYNKAKAAIHIVDFPNNANLDLSFEDEGNYLLWEGNYLPHWEFSIPILEWEEQSFSYKEENFITFPTPAGLRPLNFNEVYLDITNNWTADELSRIQSIFKGTSINYLDLPSPSITSLDNYANFNLYPYYKLPTTSIPLIITKGGVATPNLEDLEGYSFKKDLFAYLSKTKNPPLVLDIGKNPTDYNRSLKEFGVISHHMVTVEELTQFVTTGMYPDPMPNPNIVHIQNNGVSIQKVNVPGHSPGSDHLMRLYYYQSIMNKIGTRYFIQEDSSYIEDELTDIAANANVVTPLSSLIVLESQNDYERFEIKRDKDSLGNASIKNQGAVPEPHEWALIIAGTLLLLIMYAKRRRIIPWR